MARDESQAYFIAASPTVTGPLIPVPGGVLLFSNQGQLVGAIGFQRFISWLDACRGPEAPCALARSLTDCCPARSAATR